MKSLRFLDRRVGFSLGALTILMGAVVPAVVPTFASAAQLQTRSIQMGDSTAGASSTTYTIHFDPQTTDTSDTASYVTILFCDSASGSFEGAACTSPGTMFTGTTSIDVSGTGSSDTSAAIGSYTNNAITVNTKLASTTKIVLDNVANPSTLGPFYARIETFPATYNGGTGNNDTSGGAETNATAAQTSTVTGGIADFGGVALATTNQIGVNAYVEEQMNFCVSGVAPGDACGSTTTPTVTLGTAQGSQYILPSIGVPTPGTVYAQMTTNAVGGAIVSMKSDATGCGGLYLKFDTSDCGIPPETAANHTWSGGEGLFGLAVGSEACASTGTCPATGDTLAAYGNYNTASDYYMGYASDNSTGVTSPYGDEILSTNGPIGNENIPLNFNADASPTTPAGQYQANLSLIATGTF